MLLNAVIPAKAGIHWPVRSWLEPTLWREWIPRLRGDDDVVR